MPQVFHYPRALLIAVIMAGCSSPPQTEHRQASTRIEQGLVGTWVHVGSPGRAGEIPESGGRFKHRTGDHWNLTVVEADSGLVTENFGGTYIVKGDEYVETQHYATPQWMQDNDRSWRFRVEVDGDTMTQYGIDNSFNEVWKRVKP